LALIEPGSEVSFAAAHLIAAQVRLFHKGLLHRESCVCANAFAGRRAANFVVESVGRFMKELVESIARALVDHPDDVQVKSIEGAQATILELRVHKDDLGKVIGRQGRTAKAVRTLLGAAGVKLHKRFTLEILED